MRAILTLACLVIWSLAAIAQTRPAPAPGTQKPGMTPRPPLLFSETWSCRRTPASRPTRTCAFTPAVRDQPALEVKLYGPDAKVIRAAVHEERVDLWNGMTSSPTAVTLRDRRNYLDLTDAARLRWIVRTNAIHSLHPVVKLADGRLIVGDRAITTHGEFLHGRDRLQRHALVRTRSGQGHRAHEVVNPDLSKVDEVGLAMLSPGGGHGIAGSANLSNVELFAYPVPR